MKQINKRSIVLIIALLLLITVIALGVTIWALFFRAPNVELTPDYAPQEIEQNAETIADDPQEKLEADEGGGAVSISYGANVSIILSNQTAALYFANPARSTQDMLIQIVAQDTVLVQSGRIEPGNQVTTLALAEGAADMLSVGGYEGTLMVYYYDRTTGERAMVNTEIPVVISVVE